MSSKGDKLDHLDSRSQELFLQYRAVAKRMKKRFMKKPGARDIREASEDYGRLANGLKNSENPQYAAMCFTAMARCDQLLADVCGEAEAWANAGRQYLTAEDLLFTGGYPSYEDSLDAGIQCFMLAIEAQSKQGNEVMAAMFCLEIAHKLKHFQKYHQAIVFFQKAVDFQIKKPECYLQTLEKMAECRIKLRQYDSALAVYSRITMETKGREGSYAVLRQECEVCQLLLLLMLQYPKSHLKPEHSQLVKQYSQNILDENVVGPGSNGDLYVLLQSVLMAVEARNYQELEDLQPHILKHLSPGQQHLFALLMEAHDSHKLSIL